MLYLIIAYDTPSDKRRRRMFRALQAYGERKQLSLFEARVSRTQWAELRGKLEAIVDTAEDTLAAYFLSPEALGRVWRVGHRAARDVDEPDFI